MSGNIVLLIEDNPTTRKLVRFALERAGYVVLEAPDGKTALALLEAQAPSLILLDLVLPDVDGFELATELRARTKQRDVSLLVFSGFVSRAQESRISAMGFDDIVTKPIEPSRLVQVVSAHRPLARPKELFGAGKKLIVADDDPFQLKLTRFRLARLGFEVETAVDGKQALELARDLKPDAIVSDVMMPNLDGFGLVLAVRDDTRIADMPIVLVTSSYVEPADRALAQRAGATDLVVRSPDLEDLVRAVRSAIDTSRTPSQPLVAPDPVVEAERAQRTVRHLEREVQMNAGLARRCASLSAELAILAGISDAMLAHRDLDTAIDDAIAACFDAGGISVGALYLLEDDGSLRARTLGGATAWTSEDISTFFGHEALLRELMASGKTRSFSMADGSPEATALLAACGGSVILAVPLVYDGRTHGAIVMVARGRELDESDWRAFSQGVGNQITQALALASAFRDRERAERRAYEQATLLQHVLDSIAEGVVVTNAEGRVMVWNAAAERIVPLTEGQGNERWAERYENFLRTDSGRVGMNTVQLERALQGEKTAPVEIFVSGSPSREGSWVSSHSRPLSAGDGSVRGSVTVMKDVTESRRASLEVLASRARWQALVEHAPDFVLNIDRRGVVRFINRVVPGMTRSDLVGSSWLKLVPEERHAELTAAFEMVLETGVPQSFETVSAGGESGVAWYASHLGPIRQGDEIVGAVLIARDITQKKETEAQLIVSDRLASVGTLAAGVAHEINNPLASVIANIELAIGEVEDLTSRGISSNEAGLALRDARESANRVRRIVRDLNIFSRSDDEGERASVSAEQVLESTLRIAWNDIRHRARLVRTYRAVPNVLVNESRLGQVFLNLLVNAAHAIPDGAADTNEIAVSIDTDGNRRVVVTITDTGCGIPEPIQRRMFTPFLTTKPAGIGTGLGLSICHRIVTASGGELTFDSAEGVGTTFRVYLPIAPERLRKVSVPPPIVPAPRRAKILVIDDEEIVARAVRRTLQDEHDVTLSLGARPAIAMLDAGEVFDLILCDVMMPDMTGMDFYHFLEAHHPALTKQLIFLTGGAFTPRAREFLDRVGCARIEKPFDRQGLRSRVNELLG